MMNMLEICANDLGAHRIQTWPGRLPDGWAMIPAGLALEGAPFGVPEITTVQGVPTVTGWTPTPWPEPEPDEPQDDEGAVG